MIRMEGINLRYESPFQASFLQRLIPLKEGRSDQKAKGSSQPLVLKKIDLNVPRGSFVYLTGVSGAGKSSLLKLIYLKQQPTSGALHIFGKSVWSSTSGSLPHRERARLRQSIGVVFQDYRLIETLSVEENVALPLRIAGEYTPKRRADILDLLTWVGLGDLLSAKPSTLSGGQKQRVALARAVIARPKLLLADEPTGNLDGGMGARLIFLLEELNRLGTTVMVATHSTPLVARFPHPVFHLHHGKGQALSAEMYLRHFSDDAVALDQPDVDLSNASSSGSMA